MMRILITVLVLVSVLVPHCHAEIGFGSERATWTGQFSYFKDGVKIGDSPTFEVGSNLGWIHAITPEQAALAAAEETIEGLRIGVRSLNRRNTFSSADMFNVDEFMIKTRSQAFRNSITSRMDIWSPNAPDSFLRFELEEGLNTQPTMPLAAENYERIRRFSEDGAFLARFDLVAPSFSETLSLGEINTHGSLFRVDFTYEFSDPIRVPSFIFDGAIPEPTSACLVLASLVGCSAYRRRVRLQACDILP